MKIELITLCEGAFNTNGRLTIVNTIDDILAKSFPWKAALGLALKIGIPAEEKGTHDLSVSFTTEDGSSVLHNLTASFTMPFDGMDGHLVVATNIQGLSFTKSGRYFVDITIDKELLHRLGFRVIQN